VSEPVVSDTAAQIVLSHQWNGENQLLSPQDIIRLDALDRLETIILIIIVIKT
jgi:hypothetical protein